MYTDEEFYEISLKGIVAYSITCFENVLLSLKYNDEEWKEVLEDLWLYTSIKYIDDWQDIVSDIIPSHLLEFDNYEDSDFETLTLNDYEKLYKIYVDCDEIINNVMLNIFFLGTSQNHKNEDTVVKVIPNINYIKDIINCLELNNMPVPNINSFKQYSATEKDGWGFDFEGRKLSKILK